MASTTSSTQPADDDQIVVGSCLTSTSSKYLVQSILGQGSYGTVAKCARVGDNQTVAIKIMKPGKRYEAQSQAEVKMLAKLRMLDPDKCNIVRWYQVFSDRQRTCLMFEELDKSLFDFMCERRFQPLPLKDIRTVVMQIANALNHLKAIGVIHADLKLENVMLVNHAQEPYRVKVIDFGLACNVSSAKPGAYLQARPYRSPEIILGLPFTQAIDMWSLGCIAATLCLGTMLYPGKSDYDVIKYIVETQGQPSDDLLSHGQKTRIYFQRDEKSTTCLWKLKTPEQFHLDTQILPTDTRMIKLSSLDDLRHIRPTDPDNPAERIQLHTFVDMLKGMLHLDPTKRISPRQVLEYLHSSTWNKKDQTKSKQDSAAVKIHPPQPLHHKSTHPSTSSKTQCYIGTGTKRKMPDSEDLGDQQTDAAHNDKPHDDRKRFRKSYESPSTSRSSSGTQSCVLPGIKRKTPHDEDSDSDKRSGHETKRVRASDTSRPTCSSSNFSTHTAHVPDQMKRKMADIENVRHQQIGSDHFVTSHNDRGKFQKSYRSPSTLCSSQTQRSISPGVKRKMPDPEDSDYDKSSGHERKRIRESD